MDISWENPWGKSWDSTSKAMVFYHRDRSLEIDYWSMFLGYPEISMISECWDNSDRPYWKKNSEC